ncbi:hypothetical protein AB0B83_19505 [Micromonospora sp. NPDC049060]|uniref:hypothetical protein n=1 Tax=Micromonospora sp. NPDC049060 TaxID=3154828 RepID=UPI0033DC08DC
MSSSWLPLVVDEGQLARAEGLLIRLGRAALLIPDGGTVVTADSQIVATSTPVELRVVDSSIYLDRLENQAVVAQGAWTDRTLAIDDASSLTVRPEAAAVARRDASSSFTGQALHKQLQRRPPVERSLLEDGHLLDLWTADRGTGDERHIALATDVAKVRAALAPLFGESLVIIESRWTEGMFREIEAVLGESELVASSGREVGADFQMKVAVTLLHLPTRLARRLGHFPAEALALRLLVIPA